MNIHWHCFHFTAVCTLILTCGCESLEDVSQLHSTEIGKSYILQDRAYLVSYEGRIWGTCLNIEYPNRSTNFPTLKEYDARQTNGELPLDGCKIVGLLPKDAILIVQKVFAIRAGTTGGWAYLLRVDPAPSISGDIYITDAPLEWLCHIGVIKERSK